MNPALTAEILYVIDTGEKFVNETFSPNIQRRRTGAQELKPMPVRDGRPVAGEVGLEPHGFIFIEYKTKVRDFFDAAELKSVYYPEVERLVREESGALRVRMFDHTLRSSDEAEQEAKLVRWLFLATEPRPFRAGSKNCIEV